MRALATLVFVLALTSCQGAEPVAGPNCADYALVSIVITVEDSLSGTSAGMRNVWARGVSVDGHAYHDSTFNDSPDATLYSLLLFTERTGVFHVTVGAQGYREWEGFANVTMGPKPCPHVQPVLLRARLLRP